jgi:mono/diheme cytochrome c family protein
MVLHVNAFRGQVVLCLAALPWVAVAAGGGTPFQPTQVSATPDRGAGLQAFAQIERVLLHPRCVNCHVPDGPLQGDLKRVHYPPVQRGTDGKGVAPLTCATCHSTQNSPLAHAPPGLDTDGQPGWHMPPANMKMSWIGLSGAALCKVFREPRTNGGRSIAMLEEHMVTDHLVAWGWHPGPGRELPPLDKPAFDEQVRTWIRNGAPCDATEPLRTSVGRTKAAATDDFLENLRAVADLPALTGARQGSPR